MKLRKLRVEGYKNLRLCDIQFENPHFINAIIGGNGSGKSNLIEAILHILTDVFFRKAPPFPFELEFETQKHCVLLEGNGRRVSSRVDDTIVTLHQFVDALRDGPVGSYFPDLVFVYYSGECRRVRQLINRYRRYFLKLTRNPNTAHLRPLFVESGNEQSQVILLALFAHRLAPLLSRLGLDEVIDVSVVLRSPLGFDPERHEPKLWNTEGAVREMVAAFEETSRWQDSIRSGPNDGEYFEDSIVPRKAKYSETRRYRFDQGKGGGLVELADRLSRLGSNVYLALESLRARGMFQSVDYQLKRRDTMESFPFKQLSEGEKQLIAVVGAIQLTNQQDSLILLDEPDTHLNPHWSWDYPSMLAEAVERQQKTPSSVLMATHDPVMISGLVREQVLLAHDPGGDGPMFTRPVRNPRGQGIANLLCSSEFFGLPSSLDKETQVLMDERLRISIKPTLTERDKERLRTLNKQLEFISPGVSERDPDYVEFLRQRHAGR